MHSLYIFIGRFDCKVVRKSWRTISWDVYSIFTKHIWMRDVQLPLALIQKTLHSTRGERMGTKASEAAREGTRMGSLERILKKDELPNVQIFNKQRAPLSNVLCFHYHGSYESLDAT